VAQLILSIDEINAQVENGLTVFQQYLGPIKINHHYKSPFGHEGRPCFHLYVGPGNQIRFKDFAFDEMQGSCYDFVMKWHGVDFKEAVSIIKRDVLGLTGRDLESGLTSKPMLTSNFKKLASQTMHQHETVHLRGFPRPWQESDLAFFGKIGVSLPTLQKYHCYALDSYLFSKDDKHFTITAKSDDPIYGYHFPATDHWKIYRPFTADKRFRWLSNVKGDVDVFGWDALPTRTKKLFICAGQRDTMALHELTGAPCIALNSETAKLTPELHQFLLCVADEVYCCLDNDKTGIEAQRKMRYDWGVYDAGHEVLEAHGINDLSKLLEEYTELPQLYGPLEEAREKLRAHFCGFSVDKCSTLSH